MASTMAASGPCLVREAGPAGTQAASSSGGSGGGGGGPCASATIELLCGAFSGAGGSSQQRVVKIGRSKGKSDVLLNSDRFPGLISRKHAVLRVAESSPSADAGAGPRYEVHLEDLGGANGTYVDGKRVKPHAPVRLRHGQCVTFGGKELITSSGSDGSPASSCRNEFVYRFVQGPEVRHACDDEGWEKDR